MQKNLDVAQQFKIVLKEARDAKHEKFNTVTKIFLHNLDYYRQIMRTLNIIQFIMSNIGGAYIGGQNHFVTRYFKSAPDCTPIGVTYGNSLRFTAIGRNFINFPNFILFKDSNSCKLKTKNATLFRFLSILILYKEAIL